ncbi:MAG: hypothetical protein IJN60_02740 [Oscillospiraceae bacterium]|nr:hypothetical protein [Oscillospiraceae bacterium]
MKKVIIISVVVFLLIALALGVSAMLIERLPAPITPWEKKQLEKEYGKYGISPPQWMDKNGEGGCTFYYGKYNGYYIICDTIEIQISNREEVGDYIFKLGSRTLYALKNGESYKLGDLYVNGEISDKEIAKIYEYHKNTFDQYYDEE